MIAIIALRDLKIHQMDIKIVFLNDDLKEKIYMKQPQSFVIPGQENKLCRLIKSFYGLQHAPKQWHEKFDSTMMSNGFKINECDKCIYYKPTKMRMFCYVYMQMICLLLEAIKILSTK